MVVLFEALHISSSYITGIERHLQLQIEILDTINYIKKAYIVYITNPPIINSENIEIEFIKIGCNCKEDWESVYSSYSFDILYSTFVPPALLPSKHIPVLYVLHDPGRYLFPDLMENNTIASHITLFEMYSKLSNFFVITVSFASQRDILKLFPHLKNRLFVVYNFVSRDMISKDTNCPTKDLENKKYFLSIGRYIPTKNTLSIIKAFEKRKEVFDDFKLVVVGRKGWYTDLEEYLVVNKPSNIILKSFVSESELINLYKYAYGYISASLYEGFGMTLIEALNFGCHRLFLSDIDVYKELNLPYAKYFHSLSIEEIVDSVFSNHYSPPLNENNINFTKQTALNQFKNMLKQIHKNENNQS